MYIPDGLWVFIAILAGMIFWKVYGQQVRSALDAFDRRRIDADQQLISDMQNPRAHFRRSLEAINDKVEPVKLVKDEDGRRQPIWNGLKFDDVDAAEDARWAAVIAEARSFYTGLDEDFGLRVAGPAPKTAREE
jgi:hypothetical protein